jgi:hemerythrin-like domain-containing protein
MLTFIEEWKKEHNIIIDLLEEVKKAGIHSKEGKEKLFDAKMAFLAHLEKEDEELYPVLRKASDYDGELKNMLDVFADDMHLVSKNAHYFFERYTNGSSDIEFRLDFERLYKSLHTRILNEECTLFKEYEKLCHLVY